MSDYTQRYYRLEAAIKERVPDFKVKFKDESPFMKFLGKVMFFNKGFMTRYTTTIGKTVYFPSRALFEENPEKYFYTLSHEAVHVFDYVAHPVLFMLGYMSPQIFVFFSLFAILSFLNPYFLFFLLALLFASPLPSPYRTWAELRGYGMSCKARLWDGWTPETLENVVKDYYADAFVTSAYYFMCPFKSYIIKKLLKWAEDNNSCLSDSNPAFMDVYNIIKHIK